MKIGYWLGNGDIKSGGVGSYAWRLLELLLSQNNHLNINLLILCYPEVEKNCLNLLDKYQIKGEICLIPKQFGLLDRSLSKFSNLISLILGKINFSIDGLKYLNPWFRWFASLDIQILHVPYQTAPLLSHFPYPFVVTMHDVQEIHFPEFFTPQERCYRAINYLKALENSSAIVVSFDHIKQDLIKYFRMPESKIYVCPLPYQTILLDKPTWEDNVKYQKKFAHLPKEFILYPAQTWQHKNHLSLIHAIETINNKFHRLIHLVCTGRKNPDFFPVIENYLKQSQISDQIHFLDIVPEKELYWLYKNCSMVVIPTLYEAGSFPLLEAMSLEVPVICSSVTSLPETIGDSRFLFDPLNIPEMANLIIQLSDDTQLRIANVINSKKQFKELKQKNTASLFVEMWDKTYQVK